MQNFYFWKDGLDLFSLFLLLSTDWNPEHYILNKHKTLKEKNAGWLGTSRPKKWLSSEFSTFSLCLKYVWLGTGEASNLKMQWVQKSLLPPVKEPEKEQPRNTTFRQHSLCSKPASAPISQGQVESLDLWPPQATPRCLPSFPGGVRRDLVTHSGLSPLVSDWRPSIPTMTAEEMGRNPFLCQPVWH